MNEIYVGLIFFVIVGFLFLWFIISAIKQANEMPKKKK